MKKWYTIAMSYWNDYRSYVPSYASAALAFYLLVLLVPAASLIALFTNFFNIDLTILEGLLRQFVRNDMARMIINVLNTKRINTVSLVIIIWSIYAVSRSVRNIYDISKGMFKGGDHENLGEYALYVLKVTILLFLSMMSLLLVYAFEPISILFGWLYQFMPLRYVILFGLLVFFFMMIYVIVPRENVYYRDALTGAIVGAIGIVILYIIFGIYTRVADIKSVYGPLASIVVVLFIFDWGSEIFYIGMYITYLQDLRRKACAQKELSLKN